MCYARPRPRCSDHVQKKIESRTKVWQKRKDTLGPEHPQTLAAKQLLQTAIADLDSTDGGIKALKDDIELQPENIALKRRLAVGEATNNMRTLAGQELDIQRPQALGTLYSMSTNGYYEYAEAKSIIDASVEANIKATARNTSFDDTPVTQEEYENYLNTLEERIRHQHGGTLDERAEKTLELLRNQEPPVRSVMKTYESLDETLYKGKQQLVKEITRVAAIQGVHPRVVGAYYDGYRRQYQELYSKLPLEERPDPPKHWVEGDLSGYRNTPNTRFAPSDPASLYAMYRLKADPNAIPETHKATKRNYVSVNLITTDLPDSKKAKEGETSIIGISMTEYTPDGVEVNRSKTWVRPPSTITMEDKNRVIREQGIDMDQLKKKPRWADIQSVVAGHLRGKILITSGAERTIRTLSTATGEEVKAPYLIDVNDIASKQFSQNSTNLRASVDSMGLNEYADEIPTNGESLVIGQVYFTQLRKMRASWEKKPQRKEAPPIVELPQSSRWRTAKASQKQD